MIYNDNSNLVAYWKMAYWIHQYLETIQNGVLEKNSETEFVVNRAYYDDNAITVNFSIDKKKHLLKMEIDNTVPHGYNLYLNGESIPFNCNEGNHHV